MGSYRSKEKGGRRRLLIVLTWLFKYSRLRRVSKKPFGTPRLGLDSQTPETCMATHVRGSRRKVTLVANQEQGLQHSQADRLLLRKIRATPSHLNLGELGGKIHG